MVRFFQIRGIPTAPTFTLGELAGGLHVGVRLAAPSGGCRAWVNPGAWANPLPALNSDGSHAC